MQVIWIYHIMGDNKVLVVRAGSGIDKIAERKGKTVAVPFGSTIHYHLIVAL